ncbi:MAG: hypothetical protein NTV51_13680 [Verrucomicrobia bacterium]|nr:hypothetical protein [Verrucomicrobiota bacterium]
MLPFFKRKKTGLDAVNYSDEWRRLRNEFADPAIELAKTKQAVVVSAASVLDRIWNGHGGASWGESDEADYIAPLREHLIAAEVFSPDVCELIGQKLDKIVEVGRRNSRAIPRDDGDGIALESACNEVDYVVLRVVDWCRHLPTPIPLGADEEYHGHF